MKLYTQNFGGNLHDMARYINEHKPELAACLVVADSSGHNTVAVFRVSDVLYKELTKGWVKPDFLSQPLNEADGTYKP